MAPLERAHRGDFNGINKSAKIICHPPRFRVRVTKILSDWDESGTVGKSSSRRFQRYQQKCQNNLSPLGVLVRERISDSNLGQKLSNLYSIWYSFCPWGVIWPWEFNGSGSRVGPCVLFVQWAFLPGTHIRNRFKSNISTTRHPNYTRLKIP